MKLTQRRRCPEGNTQNVDAERLTDPTGAWERLKPQPGASAQVKSITAVLNGADRASLPGSPRALRQNGVNQRGCRQKQTEIILNERWTGAVPRHSAFLTLAGPKTPILKLPHVAPAPSRSYPSTRLHGRIRPGCTRCCPGPLSRRPARGPS